MDALPDPSVDRKMAIGRVLFIGATQIDLVVTSHDASSE